MKGRVAAFDTVAGRKASALMEDGRLADLIVDPADARILPGAVLRVAVDRPMRGAGGAMVRLPGGASGYLRRAKGLSPGDSLIAQVSGFAEEGKAPPLAQGFIVKSRFAIATPGKPGLNVAKRIRDGDTRDSLLAIARGIGPPEGLGLILRSHAEFADAAAVEDDIRSVIELAEGIASDRGAGDPELLADGADAHSLGWRDWPAPDAVEEGAGAFERAGVLDAADMALADERPLEGGGRMTVEATRALVAVDVDTGGDTDPAAGLRANLAASRSLPLALRLRGLGGQVVVDAAPMSRGGRRSVEQALAAALRADPVETTFVGWTPLGHMELTRKRERSPVPREVLG